MDDDEVADATLPVPDVIEQGSLVVDGTQTATVGNSPQRYPDATCFCLARVLNESATWIDFDQEGDQDGRQQGRGPEPAFWTEYPVGTTRAVSRSHSC